MLNGRKTWKVTTEIINKIQTFVNRCLQIIMGTRWPKVISNTELWEAPGEKPITLQIKTTKWRWISHTLRKADEFVEKQRLDWDTVGTRRRGTSKQEWKRTILEEGEKCGKTWNPVGRQQSQMETLQQSAMAYVPKGPHKRTVLLSVLTAQARLCQVCSVWPARGSTTRAQLNLKNIDQFSVYLDG